MLDETGLKKFEQHVQATLSSARTVEEFKQQILVLVNDLGFSDFDYSYIVDKYYFSFMANSLPETLLDNYRETSLYQHDIALEYVLNNEAPIFQSVLDQYVAQPPFRLNRNHQDLSIRNLMNSYGYHNAYIIPLKTKDMAGRISFSVLSKGVKSIDFQLTIEQSREKLHQLGHDIHIFTLCKFPNLLPVNQKNNRFILTRRQIQVWETLAKQAKKSQQAGDYLNISVRTVNKHIEEAKESLGAFSTTNAIYLAIEKS